VTYQMRDASGLKSPAVADSTRVLGEESSSRRVGGLLPFHWIEAIAICSDLVVLVSTSVVTGIAYHLAFTDGAVPVNTFLGIGALAGVNFSALLAARGDYRPQNLVGFWRQVRETTIIWLFVFFILTTAAFLLKVSGSYSRGATLTFFVVGWFVITVWRFAIARGIGQALAEGTFAEQKVILLSLDGQLAGADLVDGLKRCGYRAARTYEFSPDVFSSANGSSRLFNSMKEIVEISRTEKIECMFLMASWNNRRAIEQLMESLRVLSIPVYLLPDRNVAHLLGNRIVDVGTAWAAELKRAPLTRMEQVFKRVLDALIGSLVIILLAPMMALIAIFIKFDSRGPILFMQTRNGFNGRPFRIWKFRTMFVLEDGPTVRQATRDDPRVTRLGRLLRRANIDELPQLFNVIAGDMSLVGPRPHPLALNSEYENIIANYAFRHHVKPGLTGWAQVNGFRGETQTVDLMAKRVEFDLWYIDNWSPWLDLKILLRTLILGLQPTAY
jgi:Undecaprenyl-phosphate glucose phosphotransferase